MANLTTKQVAASTTEEGIHYPAHTLYRYTDEAGEGGIWHISEAKARASFGRWEAGAAGRARRKAMSERLSAAVAANPYADDPFARFDTPTSAEQDAMQRGGNHIGDVA